MAGESAEALLAQMVGTAGSAATAAVQKKGTKGKQTSLSGRLVTFKDGDAKAKTRLRAQYNKGTAHGVEPGWSVKWADGSTFEIVETTETSCFVEGGSADALKANGKQVTFVPVRKSDARRALEKSAPALKAVDVEGGDKSKTTFVTVPRGSAHGVEHGWSAQFLNLDGSPRLNGTIVNVDKTDTRIEFPGPRTKYPDGSRYRLVPNKR